MEPPKYDGTIHPEEWVKQIRLFCQLNKITTDQEILKICKLSINSNINISREENINTVDELIKILKENTFFIIFKNNAKKKLQNMKYVPEKGGDTVKFIRDFCSLCYDADISKDIFKVKKYLYQTLRNDKFLQEEFVNKVESVESMDELIEKFDEIFSERKPIKYGSRVALMHVATGKYLTSVGRYYEGSQRQIVFVGKSLPTSDSTWIIASVNNKKYGDLVEYGCKVGLINEKTSKALCDTSVETQTKSHYYVSCDPFDKSVFDFHWRIENAKFKETNSLVGSQDIINIICVGVIDYFLSSHEAKFKVGNDTFQGVVTQTNNERIGRNNEWCIELIE